MNVDLIIRNATVVTASDVWPACDIAIKEGFILSIGSNLPVKEDTRVLDAEGAFVTPGGVDAHCHLSQFYNPGPGEPETTPTTDGIIPAKYNFSGDTQETGSLSAICGGTTTIISFANQFRGDDSLVPVIEEYHKLAEAKSYCDYAFHVIITNLSKKVIEEDLQLMVEKYGITSVKIFMTYESAKLNDYQILDVMHASRKLGITTMIHAENGDVIDWMTDHLEVKNMVAPHHHGTSRPPIVEAEASNRAICLSEVMDTPILLVHVSSGQAAKTIREAQTRLLPVFGETCPHYLFLLAERMKRDGFEGAKYVCSPPLRENYSDLEAMWQGIKNGTFTIVSSDHAPTQYDHPNGKKLGLHGHEPHGKFRCIPNGLPGLETRVPLLFSGGVVSGRITPQKFVEMTSSNPAKLYGLKNKGTIAPGFDADIVIWYPQEKFEPFNLENKKLHHSIDYTPFEGMEFKNWPRHTLIRGKVVFSEGKILGHKGFGRFQRRTSSLLARPRDIWLSEWRP